MNAFFTNSQQKLHSTVIFFTGIAVALFLTVSKQYLTPIWAYDAEKSMWILSLFLIGVISGRVLVDLILRKFSSAIIPSQLAKACEIGFTLWAILSIFLYQYYFTREVSNGLFSSALTLQILSTLILLGPPALFSGMLSVLRPTLFASRKLLALFIFGTVLGVLAGEYVLLTHTGVTSITVLIALLCLFNAALLHFTGSNSANNNHPQAASPQKLTVFIACFLLGGISFELPKVLLRVIEMTPTTSAGYASFVTAEILLLTAFGIHSVSFLQKLSTSALSLLTLFGLVYLYFLLPGLPLSSEYIRSFFGNDPGDYPFFLLALGISGLAFLALPVISLVATVIRLLLSDSDPQRLNQRALTMYLLGGLIGHILGHYSLAITENISTLFWLLILLGLLTSEMISLYISRPKTPTFRILIYVLVALTLSGTGWSSAAYRLAALRSGSDVQTNLNLSLDQVNQTLSVATIKSAAHAQNKPFTRLLLANGVVRADTEQGLEPMRLLGHLPALFGTGTGKVALLGFGTGITASSVSLYSNITDIDICDVHEDVAKIDPYFQFANKNIISQKKLHLLPGSCRNFLLEHKATYATIMLPPDTLLASQEDSFHSYESHQIIKQALKPSGIFASWISLNHTSVQQVKLILGTLQKSFHELRIFKIKSGLIVLASKTSIGTDALSSLSQKFTKKEVHRELTQTGITSIQYLLGLEQWLSPYFYKIDEENSTLRPKLLSIMRRDRFSGRKVPLQLSLTPPKKWYRNRQYAAQSLLQYWLTETQEPVNIRDLLKASCGSVKINLIEPNWRYLRSVCREAAIAALLYKNVSAPEHLNAEITWLHHFTSDEPDPSMGEKSISDVLREIALYMQFDSPLVMLSPKKLLWRSSSCFRENNHESLTCRDQLLKAFIYTGHYDLAKNQLATFKRDAEGVLSQAMIKKLDYLMETAP